MATMFPKLADLKLSQSEKAALQLMQGKKWTVIPNGAVPADEVEYFTLVPAQMFKDAQSLLAKAKAKGIGLISQAAAPSVTKSVDDTAIFLMQKELAQLGMSAGTPARNP